MFFTKLIGEAERGAGGFMGVDLETVHEFFGTEVWIFRAGDLWGGGEGEFG